MRQLSEVGNEILTHRPAHIYIMVGSEYGIKAKYLDILRDCYGTCREMTSVQDVENISKRRSLIPESPCLYIVRYDDVFIKGLNKQTADEFRQLKIRGTLVCIYESEAHTSKLEKYLPEYMISLDVLSDNIRYKYLKRDFPALSERMIKTVMKCSPYYYQNNMICGAICSVGENAFNKMSELKITQLFGNNQSATEKQFKNCILYKEYNKLLIMLETLQNLNAAYYWFLQAMVDIDKEKTKPEKIKSRGYYRSPVDLWSWNDIYNMFMIAYNELKQSRMYSIDIKYSLIYLIGMLQYKQIPDMKVFE